MSGAGKRRLSSFVSVKFPVDTVKKLRKTEGVGSVFQETQHFSTITTVNGPRRIFYGKRTARVFWILIVSSIFAFLMYQIVIVLLYLISKPTLSQISFIANEGGMDFPAVTICSLNPVKTSFIKKLNSSGDLSDEVLNYLLATKTNSMYMFNNADINTLKYAHDRSMSYLRNHPDLQIVDFLNSAQFDCDELFETCYFGGREFDCCKFMTQSVTSLGKCWEINLQNGTELWMKKQVAPMISAKTGLQIVANARHAEQFASFHYSSFQENGFRFFIHPPQVSPDLASEGILVSPSRIVNTAIKAVLHDLLNHDNWGNCTSTWSDNYVTDLPYSSSVCQALCVANHFEKLCECIPYTYNINNKPDVCFPYEEVSCMKEKMIKTDGNGTTSLNLPFCAECHLACQRSSYVSYASYGDGFNNSSMTWIMNLTGYKSTYIKENIAVINIHFMELFYTSYSQVKNTSIWKVLNQIFGLNGLWFGMSVVSLTELILYITKVSWLAVSRRRRKHLFQKKMSEKRKEEILEAAVQENEEIKSRRSSAPNLKELDDDLEEEEDYWYRNPHPYSETSLDSVIQLAIDFEKFRNPSSKSLSKIPEENEDTVHSINELVLRL
ncbi:hypothetical protein GCK72_018897 [Caenorhabditis remanei]|uniref:Uncharacterized protein n=1 Tax=Caenorhabditis remanei TaxID=31234 RepID=A0A6A5GCF0_CAERE|nr:hypothetical protein GCK72_018897 [Caenorhabditis remanei]KAF1752343.1 hypothetical protein GCK72_018897 [Caenorhabditis remanei]